MLLIKANDVLVGAIGLNEHEGIAEGIPETSGRADEGIGKAAMLPAELLIGAKIILWRMYGESVSPGGLFDYFHNAGILPVEAIDIDLYAGGNPEAWQVLLKIDGAHSLIALPATTN